jgi:integrase
VRGTLVDAGLCRTEVNKRVRHVVRMFRWAVAEELVAEAVYTVLQAVPGLRKGHTEARESDPVRPVPNDRVEAVLPFLPAAVAAMVRIQRLTGMRPGEVTALRAGDIDRSVDVWAFRPRDHETAHRGKGRTVYTLADRNSPIMLVRTKQ